jgi:hypothetical protein
MQEDLARVAQVRHHVAEAVANLFHLLMDPPYPAVPA